METKEAIYERRSIRRYQNRPVEDEKLMQVIEAGTMAPSGVNLQPWFFIIVKSEERLREVREVAGNAFTGFRPTLERRFPDHPDTIEDSRHFMEDGLGGAPICILVFALRPDYPERITAIESVSAAIQNMLLMAHDLGLGSCWLTAALVAGMGEEIRERFAPDKGEYIGMVTLGYAEKVPKMPPRRGGRYIII